MKRILPIDEVIYNIDLNNAFPLREKNNLPEYYDVYKKIKFAFNINKEGYNVYVVDSFSKDKIENIMNYVNESLSSKESPKDICYVIYEDSRYPTPLLVKNSLGKKLKKVIELIKEDYFDAIVDFYNSSDNKEKEDILDDIYKKRSHHIGVLIDLAKNQGFDLKSTSQGFAFIPLKEGIAMTEKEYDTLKHKDREDILNKASKLKSDAAEILEELKELEITSIKKIKDILKEYLKKIQLANESKYEKDLVDDENSLEYFKFVNYDIQEALIENYTMNFDDDEDKIIEIINKYVVNVIVDNSDNKTPRVIFEEDPTINNLLGNIEYENHNGVYTTDISLITAGSILKANEGCLILRMSSLVNNAGSYYYLKKTLLNQKVSYDFNRGYFELLSLNGLKPLPIDINLKVILIGDFESYDLLYNYDEDFENLFSLRSQFNPVVDINNQVISEIMNSILEVVDKNNLHKVTEPAIKEIFKYLSRKASNRKKIYINKKEIEKILFLADNYSKIYGNEITEKAIIEGLYDQELVEKEILKSYGDKKVLLDVMGERIGAVNALSVIDLGYLSFGKPIRVTSICTKGQGRIIDAQKESNLSGNIHSKSVAIIHGVLSNFFSAYETMPVDFHLSFEQTYGMLDGDSASVAQLISILSSLSKIPVRQNIAVTGSINQFGEVQPIGGVNEKIEGFFNVCSLMNNVENKGVLIPSLNADEIVLNPKVEKAVKEGTFTIYTMDTLSDALEILMLKEGETIENLLGTLKSEVDKYKSMKKL
ncbi:AAA family ATPase [Clostridium sp. 'White wine YQ']|uniref:AAA family ATPase n=1 Tax=Clostridium sp. 'White wine YQ' TaxID=3027474 RepID=UPI0023654293|nr:AAA family ATPase [Clostridium sp. 'White wine YQ']MDD7794561.1 AAA family ATPase [Clostridium sp. 'White wine YQ']